MRIRWPEGIVFTRVVLDVEQDSCEHCGSSLHVCDHRVRRICTLEGPVRLCCRLRHCADPACPLRHRTLSPSAELALALPGWPISWDVFCFMGHRRFARRWPVPQLRAELRDCYGVALTVAAIGKYLRRYQAMVAARQQDRQQLSAAYRNAEVRASLQRNLDVNKPGPGQGQLERLAECIDRGLEAVQGQQQEIKKQAEQIRAVAETLKEDTGPRWQRKARYEKLRRQYEKQGGGFPAHLAKVMRSWAEGLFVQVKVKRGEGRPTDNDELERWFRRPKSHARRIHGRQHAGMRIVQEGPTLLPTLNAHETHPRPFTAAELLPCWQALEPEGRHEALHCRKVMRKARSRKS